MAIYKVLEDIVFFGLRGTFVPRESFDDRTLRGRILSYQDNVVFKGRTFRKLGEQNYVLSSSPGVLPVRTKIFVSWLNSGIHIDDMLTTFFITNTIMYPKVNQNIVKSFLKYVGIMPIKEGALEKSQISHIIYKDLLWELLNE